MHANDTNKILISDMDCVFCKIAKKETPAAIAYEDVHVVAFKDIKQSAPVHYLVVPKEHIESVSHLKAGQELLVGQLVLTAKKLAEKFQLKGYKLVFNVGREGGQIIDHLHLHLLGGWKNGGGDLSHPALDK